MFAEARAAHGDVTAEQFLVRGGFPELYENPDIAAEGFLRSYVATYLERDLRQLLQVSSLRDFERFLCAAALRSAQLLNRADLARDTGVSGSTAGAWLSALTAPATPVRCAVSPVISSPARSGRCRSSAGRRTRIRSATMRAPCRWMHRTRLPIGHSAGNRLGIAGGRGNRLQWRPLAVPERTALSG